MEVPVNAYYSLNKVIVQNRPLRPQAVFGTPKAGVDYRLRPGAYTLILNSQQQLMLVRTSKGYFLPGGGMKPGENSRQCLQRELLEEAACSIDVGPFIAKTCQYTYVESQRCHMKMVSYFYAARLVSSYRDKEHVVEWVDPGKAVTLLYPEQQVWVVQSLFSRTKNLLC